jgi:hypothetical protein
VSDFPLHAWRYHARIDASGTDRQNLPDCLEGEDLACFQFQDRETCYEQIRAGEWTIAGAFAEPYVAFPQDLAIVSLYLFQIVKGVEISERYVSRDKVDDVRAWKVVARRGEWVKVALQVGRDDLGAFHVNADEEDLEVVRARWADYPLWFHDGMRRKHPTLRDL